MAIEEASWVTQDFMKRVLCESENDDSITVHDVVLKTITEVGDNVASDILKVIVQFSRGDGQPEAKFIILKYLSTNDDFKTKMAEATGVYQREKTMIMDTLNGMNKFLNPAQRLNAKGLYAQENNPFVIALEDLTPLGFRMVDRRAGLDLNYSLLVMRRLAEFHAASVALCEKEPKHKKMYSKGLFTETNNSLTKIFIKKNISLLANEMSTWPELDKSISEKILKLADRVVQKLPECMKLDDNEFNVINHGDLWTNNMLFRFDNEDKPVDQIFIDFQWSYYGHPAIDLCHFINTSVNPETYKNSKRLLVNEYFDSLCKTMKSIGCRTPLPEMADIVSGMRKRCLLNLTASFVSLPMSMVDKADMPNIAELQDTDNSQCCNPAYSNKDYRAVIRDRVLEFNENGWLDS